MASFSILLFFAVTGITLNHQGALNGEPKVTRFTGQPGRGLGQPVRGPRRRPARNRRAAAERARHQGAPQDFRVDDDQIAVSFKGPGYAADAFVDRKNGPYDLTETRLGLVAIINDLHKGRDTGTAWAQVIDISAIVMMLVSLTGLHADLLPAEAAGAGPVGARDRHGGVRGGVRVSGVVARVPMTPRSHTAVRVITAAAAVAAAAACLAASPFAQQQPTFRSTVDLIAVDVQVVDGNGRPIPRLDANRFSVEINGQKRRVVSADFVEHTDPDAPARRPIDVVESGQPASALPRVYVMGVDVASFNAGRVAAP